MSNALVASSNSTIAGAIPRHGRPIARLIPEHDTRREEIAEAIPRQKLPVRGRLGITQDRAPEDQDVLRLARQHRLSVYDAAYLELALRNRIGLVTLDAALVRAAREEAVPLIGLA